MELIKIACPETFEYKKYKMNPGFCQIYHEVMGSAAPFSAWQNGCLYEDFYEAVSKSYQNLCRAIEANVGRDRARGLVEEEER